MSNPLPRHSDSLITQRQAVWRSTPDSRVNTAAKRCRCRIAVTALALVLLTGFSVESKADDFEPNKYFQAPGLLSAIASAASTLIACNEGLAYSEASSKEDDTDLLTLSITCSAWEKDDGTVGTATAKVVFEKSDDGSLSPMAFEYDIP
jgi:hypothetical protein